MPLKVSLRAGERVIVNGALISVDSPTSLVFHNRVTMILERQIMRPEQANTPSRRIYFAIQNAYVSDENERPGWLERAASFVSDLRSATTQDGVRSQLDQIKANLDALDFYPAMRTARELFAHDDAMLGPMSSDPED